MSSPAQPTIFITGGTSGLGAACSHALAANGAHSAAPRWTDRLTARFARRRREPEGRDDH